MSVEELTVTFGTWRYTPYFSIDFETNELQVHGLAFGTPKFYIVPYDKIDRGLVNLSYNCDVKSGLRQHL